ncbi:MAG: PEP-CTERM sorting domain-containing protein [Planctomycetaceae bacterium]|nr:PEP-CTERM sorting domain-containing protein [Planctomycetaceae bacterium]
MKFKSFATVLAVAASMSVASLANAAPTNVEWTGSDSFNNEAINFTPFFADSFTGVVGAGIASADTRTFFDLFVDLFYDGVWNQVFHGGVNSNSGIVSPPAVPIGTSPVNLGTLITPSLPIAIGTAGVGKEISGIRLRSVYNPGSIEEPGTGFIVYSQFAALGDRTAEMFTFNSVQQNGSDVPEPTSMALFGLTALGMGIGARRRKRQASQEAALES